MRTTISLLAVLGLVTFGTVGYTAEVEAQSSECVYCDSVTGSCEFSEPGTPDYHDCEPFGNNCAHWGSSCEIDPALQTTADGTVRFASRSEAETETRASSGRLDEVSPVRDCSGVILARVYPERALEGIRESTARIIL